VGVDLANSFEAPAVRAKLSLFLLFARVTRENLPFIYQQIPQDYVPFLEAIGDGVVEAISTRGAPAPVDKVWKSIKASQRFLAIPADGLDPIVAALDNALSVPFGDSEAIAYMNDANVRAVDWIRQLRIYLSARPNVSALDSAAPRDVSVGYDAKVQIACATSSRTGPIMWWLQPKQFAFYSAVLLDLTFVHEYLCHVIPVNRQLEKDIREIWLHSGIAFGMRNLPDPRSERHPVKFVWQMFRNGYAKHHNIDEFHVGGPLSLDDLARDLSGRPLFWTVTLAILAAPDGQEQADRIARLFNRLSSFNDVQLDGLQASGQTTIATLDIAASILQSMR
jgi:hypothetical protein